MYAEQKAAFDVEVVVTGTDPSTCRGGIGFVMPAFLEALERTGFRVRMIPTYNPERLSGKWWPWTKGLFKVAGRIRQCKSVDRNVIIYSHPGAAIAMCREGVLLWLMRLLGARSMLHVHATECDRYLKNRMGRLFVRCAFGGASRLCVLTPWWENRICSYIDTPVSVIGNPMPASLEKTAKISSQICPMAQVGSGQEQPFTVLTMTRLSEGKGVDRVLRMMPLLRQEVRLLIAGDGPQRRQLESLADELGLRDRVRFEGWVENEGKERLFRQADMFCLPSRNDSFGMVYLEAMANGLPIVALDYQSTPFVVPSGRVGILAKNDEPETLAKAINELSKDRELCLQMSKNAKKWVLEKYSMGRISILLKEAVLETLGKAARQGI